MIDLLTPTGSTTVPLTESSTYSEAAIHTAARLIVENLEPPLPLTYQTVESVARRIDPWTPVHPKQGKITKRITAILHKQLSASIPDNLVQYIGAYLATDLPGGDLLYDITDRLNWQAGDFGDHNSCFVEKTSHMALMERAGIKALRFYSMTKGEPKGIGRAWVAEAPIGHAVLFNAYGPSLEQFKARLKILAPDRPTKVVSLTNFGNAKGTLYINLGAGILVGKDASDVIPRHINLEINLGRDNIFRCPSCDSLCDAINSTRTHDGGRVCSTCLAAKYQPDCIGNAYWPIGALTQIEWVADYRGDARLTTAFVHPTNIRQLATCGGCHHYMQHFSYVSVAGERLDLCGMCLEKLDLSDGCYYCGAYKKGLEKCYCRN